jgi:MtrB/PioB family decaheme-associated outer membrane protein
MNSINTYFRILLLIAGLLFATNLPAEEEEGMLEEEVEELPPLYTSKIEIGVSYSSEDSFKFGEFTGLEDEGAYAIGNIEIRKHSVIGDNDNRYWELTGSNLGLDSRTVFAEYSQDGLFDVYLEYYQIPRFRLDDAQTPFNGAGTSNQTLPAGWVTNTGDGALPAGSIDAFLKNIDIETERQRFGGGFKLNLTDNWQAQANYRHEDKDGTDTIAAIFGATGGNPKASILAVPIDYDTDEFNVGIAYAGDKAQFNLDYHLSLFDNNSTSVFFQNPWSRTSGWAAGANYPTGVGQLGTPPENEAHQVNLSGGYNFTPRTRTTATVSYSRWLQDETFLPFSNMFAATIPLPRSNLDGDIATLFANVNLFTRITNKLNLKARYTYDDKDNDTPRDIYVRMANDSVNSQAFGTASARINWPYSLERHKVELDGSYRISPMTRLSAGYAYENKDRDYTEREETDEHTGKLKLTTSVNDTLSGWLQYSHSVRDGSTYVSNRPFLTGHDPATIAADLAADPDSVYENDPLMRKTYLADRDRDQVSATVNFYPYDTVAFTVNANYANDDYKHTEIGLQNGANFNLTFDITYTPSEDVTTYAFVTSEKSNYEQAGFHHPGNVGNLGPTTDRVARFGNAFWRVETEDLVNTIGFGGDWAVIEDKFNVQLDFTHSSGTTEIQASARDPVLEPFLPLPDLNTKITSLNISGDYKFRENTTVRLGYLYERYTTDDFALDNVAEDTLADVILLGNRSSDYNAHFVGLSLIYEF